MYVLGYKRDSTQGDTAMTLLDFDYIGNLVIRAQKNDTNAFAELYALTYQKEYRCV